MLLSPAVLMRTRLSSRCPSLEPVSHSELGAGPFNTKGGPKPHQEGQDGSSKRAATGGHKGTTKGTLGSSQVSGQEGQGRAHSASRLWGHRYQNQLCAGAAGPGTAPHPLPDTHTSGRCSVSPAGSGRGSDCGSPQLLGPPDFRSHLRSIHPRCVRGSRPLPPDPKP